MANIMDYIDWRGDLPFRYSPFNVVDNLILSQISYVNLHNIVPKINSCFDISLSDACTRYFYIHDMKKVMKDLSICKPCMLLKKVAQSRRYKNIRLSNYIDIVDEDHEEQFSAVLMKLSDGTYYVSFRGTDDTLIGWKEDFNMSYMDCIPAQVEAANYINLVCEDLNRKIRVGGHSKGGNLAIYSAIHCDDSIRDKIIAVYNNDGPGFTRDVIESSQYKNIEDKIFTIVPEQSVFGMLFDRREQYKVVKSSESGIMQHDAMTWQVFGADFEYIDDVAKLTKVVDDSIKSWIESLNNEEKAKFVEALYKVIKGTGIRKVSKLTSSKIKSAGIILKSYNSLDDETKEMVINVLNSLRIQYQRNFFSSFFRKKQARFNL